MHVKGFFTRSADHVPTLDFDPLVSCIHSIIDCDSLNPVGHWKRQRSPTFKLLPKQSGEPDAI